MEIALDDLNQIIKITGIIFALFHFLAGFVMYIDILRINKVVETDRKRQITFLMNIYLAFLLGLIIFFAFV